MPAVKTAAKRTSKTAAKKPAPQKAKKVTLDDVWATIDRIGKAHEKVEKTLDRIGLRHEELEKAHRETEKAIKETQAAHQETEKTIEKLSKNVGGINGSLGELVETLIAPHLGEKFEAYHYGLKRIFHRVNIYDEQSRQRGEIDILLSNTTVCMAVEVKRWVEKKEHVDEHIKRMELIRQYPPAEAKGKKLLGAIAGAVVAPQMQEYAEQNGLFVLEMTGEDVRLLETPKGFKPKEW
jgi:chromosome segregation ATPase